MANTFPLLETDLQSPTGISMIQHAITLFVLGYSQAQQKGPTIREIADYVDKAGSLTDYHLTRLEQTPYLTRQRTHRRTIQLTPMYREKSLAFFAQDPAFRKACVWLSSRNMDHLSVTIALGENFPEQGIRSHSFVRLLFSSTQASLPTLYWNPMKSSLALSQMEREEGKRWRVTNPPKQHSFLNETAVPFIELAKVNSFIQLL